MTPGELPEDWRKMEVVEPRPEPDPSARDEFHQVYIRKLQAADNEVEDYSKTLDSVSYPVSHCVPLSPQWRLDTDLPFTQALLSSGIILLINCETELCPASTSLHYVNVISLCTPWLTTPIRILRHFRYSCCHFPIAVCETILETLLLTTTPLFADHKGT